MSNLTLNVVFKPNAMRVAKAVASDEMLEVIMNIHENRGEEQALMFFMSECCELHNGEVYPHHEFEEYRFRCSIGTYTFGLE